MYRHNGLLVAEQHDDEGLVEVVDQDGIRSLHFGTAARQSCMMLADPSRLCIPYERVIMTLLLFKPAPARVLMIGLGGGSMARFLLQHCEHTRIDVVELRPLVVEVARRYFSLPNDPRLHISTGCGAQHVAARQLEDRGRYDVILVDAYQGGGMAPEVSSAEFFMHCRNLLRDDGLLAINLWRFDKLVLRDVTRNLIAAFDWRVHVVPVRNQYNLIGFAFASAFPRLPAQRLESEAQQLQQQLQMDFPEYLQDLRTSDPLGSLFADD